MGDHCVPTMFCSPLNYSSCWTAGATSLLSVVITVATGLEELKSQSVPSYSALGLQSPGKLVYFRCSINIYRWIDGRKAGRMGRRREGRGRGEVRKGERKNLGLAVPSMSCVHCFVPFSARKPRAMLLAKLKEENTISVGNKDTYPQTIVILSLTLLVP